MAQIPFPALLRVVTAPTLAELLTRRDAAAAGADIVELRLDTRRRSRRGRGAPGRRGPVIVTCRAAWEGGHFRGPGSDRLALLEQAWHAGAEFVDIELRAWRDAAWVGRPAASAWCSRATISTACQPTCVARAAR